MAGRLRACPARLEAEEASMKFRPAVLPVLLAALSAPAFADDGDALRDAARTGDVATVRTLLAKGVQPDRPGRHGLTALGLAASVGNLDVARLLVEKGADVNARESFFGQSVLSQAARGKHTQMVN